MENLRSLVLLIIYYLANLSSPVSGVDIPLDVAKDIDDRMWKIKGAEYIEQGSDLREGSLGQYFPSDFKFAELSMAKGIWVVVPTARSCPPDFDIRVNMDSDSGSAESNESKGFDLADTMASWFDPEAANKTNKKHKLLLASESKPAPTPKPERSTEKTPTLASVCYESTNASMQVTLRAQNIDSITITYCFGGDAIMRVHSTSEGPEEISAHKRMSAHWDRITVNSITGRSVLLEAQVFGKGDYILIDKIVVTWGNIKTSPRPTLPTTSPVPEPAPTSGKDRIASSVAMLISVFSLVSLVWFYYKY